MTQITPYPAYRDTDITWLGKIPAHWEVKRLKWTIEYCQNGAWGDEPNGVDDVACLRVADFDRIKFRVNFPVPTFRALPKAERRNKSLKKGDLLLEKSGGGDLQPVGFIVLYDSDEPAICSNFVARMPVRENYVPNFLCYLHASLYAGKINSQSIKQNTGIQNLDSAAYLNEKVAIPPLPEQRTIAAFIDRQIAKIDALIAKKQRLLELLAEKRAALITRVVTKGLNPAVEMKDSGVEWLGEVPSHWEVKRLKYISGINPSKTEIRHLPKNLDVSFLPMELVGEGNLITDTVKMLDDVGQGFTYFRDGDVVVAKITPSFENGKGSIASGLINGIGFGTTELHVIRPSNMLDVKYLYYLTTGYDFRHVGAGMMQGTAGQKRVPDSFLINYTVALPPLSEQFKMIEYLENQKTRLDNLATKVENAIERLNEYRSALISSAVTGKMDVREPSTSPGG